ncbi:hypothetical protein ACHAXS_001773, partial [Conticribra weissflogii]
MTEFIDPLGRGPKIVIRPPSPPPQPPPKFSSPMDTKFRPTMDAKPMFPDAAFESDQRVPPPPPPPQQQQHPPPSASMASSSQYYAPVQQQWSGQISSNNGSGFPPRSSLGNRAGEDVIPPSPMQIYLDRQQRSHPSASFDRSAGSSSSRENNIAMERRDPNVSTSNSSSQYPNQHGFYQSNNYQEDRNVFADRREYSSHNSHTVPASSFDRSSIQPGRPPAVANASLQAPLPPPSNYYPSDHRNHPAPQHDPYPQAHQSHHHKLSEPYHDRGDSEDPTRRGPDYPPSFSNGINTHQGPSRNSFESPPLPPVTSRSVPPPTSRSAPLHDKHSYQGPHSATNRSYPDPRYSSHEYGDPRPPPPPPLSERNDRLTRPPSSYSYTDSHNRESGHVSNLDNYGFHNDSMNGNHHRGDDRFWREGPRDGSGNYGGDREPYRGGDGYDGTPASSDGRFRSPPLPVREDLRREYHTREMDRERPTSLNSSSRDDYYRPDYDRHREHSHPYQQQRESFDSKHLHQHHHQQQPHQHSEYRPRVDYSRNTLQSNRNNDDRNRAPSPHLVDPTPLPPPQPPISPLTTATFCGTFADEYLPKSSCHTRDYNDREPFRHHSSSDHLNGGNARDRDRERDRISPYSDFACAPGDITAAGGGVSDRNLHRHHRHDGPRDYVQPKYSREHDYDRPKSSYVENHVADHSRGIPKQVLAYQGQHSYPDHRSSRLDKRDDFSESSVQTHSSTSGRQGPSSSDTCHHHNSQEH